jgi:hypothetical protein
MCRKGNVEFLTLCIKSGHYLHISPTTFPIPTHRQPFSRVAIAPDPAPPLFQNDDGFHLEENGVDCELGTGITVCAGSVSPNVSLTFLVKTSSLDIS